MKTLGNILVAILVFGFGFVSGCGTIHGLSSDIHEVSGAIERGLRPEMEKRQELEIARANAQEEKNLKKAVQIVLKNNKNSVDN